MERYEKLSYFHMFSFFLIFKRFVFRCVDFIRSLTQLQTQQVMTSLIRLRTEYLIQTYRILVLIL